MAKKAQRKAQQKHKSKKQNNVWIWGGVGVLILLVLAVVFLNNQGTAQSNAVARTITVQEAAAETRGGRVHFGCART